ncbi:hypothetical protein SL267_29080 [Serratia marcescens]|nr:hypothetical protein SL267_29080 [Serratia marcescens]
MPLAFSSLKASAVQAVEEGSAAPAFWLTEAILRIQASARVLVLAEAAGIVIR